MSPKYFYKNGRFISHVDDKICFFVINLRKIQHFREYFLNIRIISQDAKMRKHKVSFKTYLRLSHSRMALPIWESKWTEIVPGEK
jgi:hypothetical protein